MKFSDKIAIVITVAALGMATQSCDLQTEPTTSVSADDVFKSYEDGETVLNGIWRFMMESWWTYANPGFGAFLRASDAMSSDVVLNTKYGYSALYDFTGVYGRNGTNSLSWEISYQTINNCNNVIAHMGEVTGSETDRNRVKGQALALRGFIYLHLASHYSFAVDYDENATCVPIYVNPTDGDYLDQATEGMPASTVKEVYNQAIEDLETAVMLIPESYTRTEANDKYKIDRHTARAILARAALYARDWEKAYEAAGEVISEDGYLMTEAEFKSGFNDISNSEWIWGHPQTDDQSNPSYQFHFLDTTTPGSYYYSFNVDPYFRENYEDGDYRKDMIYWSIDPGADPSSAGLVWMRNSKFRFRNMDTQVADILLMRNSEMYLIAAEAGARLGKSNALELLNKVREARGAKPKTSDGDALLEDIYMERRLELWGEGFGVVDLIRLQKSVERKEWPQDQENFVEYKWTDSEGGVHSRMIQPQGHRIIKFPDGSDFSPNSKYYLFRITLDEELVNTNLYKNHPRPSFY